MVMRKYGLSVIACVIVAVLGVSVIAEEKEPADDDARNAPTLSEGQARAIAKIIGILDGKARLDVIETPFEDVCKDIEDMYKVKVVLDDENLKLAGVTRQTLITLYQKDVPLRVILRKLLEPKRLTFLVRTDGILITK